MNQSVCTVEVKNLSLLLYNAKMWPIYVEVWLRDTLNQHVKI